MSTTVSLKNWEDLSYQEKASDSLHQQHTVLGSDAQRNKQLHTQQKIINITEIVHPKTYVYLMHGISLDKQIPTQKMWN